MSKGRIKRLITDRGFGFIETTQGEDLFFHCSKLRGIEFADLHENQIVEFDVAQFPQGLQAVNVRSATGEMEQSPTENGWPTPTVSSPSWVPEPEEEFSSPGGEDTLTQREQLFIRLAVNITRGLEGPARDQLDAARQLGIDKATLSAVIDRVSKANADACRAVTADNL
ncbi:MAG: cold-shock protein [Nitrospinota bacterium]